MKNTDAFGGRTPPHNLTAEAAVLAAILTDESKATLAMCYARKITPESFYDPRHRLIYAAILWLDLRGKPTDWRRVGHKLGRHHKLSEAGGSAYLVSLASREGMAAHADFYVEIVRDKHFRRRLIERAAAAVEENLHNNDKNEPPTK